MWGYDWFLLALLIPSKVGDFGFAYSNYGYSSLPLVTKDNVGAYLAGTSIDKFESVYLTYNKKINWLEATNTIKVFRRKLINETAFAIKYDIRVTSPKVLNNRLGLKTSNLFGSDYKWSNGDIEELNQYIGVFYLHSLQFLKVLLEYDASLNYPDHSIFYAQTGVALTTAELLLGYQKSKIEEKLFFGTNVNLTDVFSIQYVSTQDLTKFLEESTHNLSIGVKF